MSFLSPSRDSTGPPARRPLPHTRVIPITATVAAVSFVSVWAWLGPSSLPGLALLALVAVLGGVLVLREAPWLPIVAVPLILFLPQTGFFFPFELLLFVATGLAVVALARSRNPALQRTSAWEAANLLFVGWALFTMFWAFDGTNAVLGARFLLIGAIAAGLSSRLPALMSRRLFEVSVVGALSILAGVAALRSFAGGVTAQTALLHRSATTDMGWGTANYVATLLLLLSPLAFALVVLPRPWWIRGTAATGLILSGMLQVLVASRAATVLFFLGLLVQAFLMLRRRARWIGVSSIVVGTTLALISPFGQGFLSRFTNIRDLGSMVIRLWYFREGWHRVQDFFWFGMGLHQGISYPDKMKGIDLHNYWLVVTSELGVIGLSLWLVTVVLQHRAYARLRAEGGHDRIALALQVSFWCGQLHTLVEPTFQGVHYQFLWFWLGMGFVGYARRESLDSSYAATSER